MPADRDNLVVRAFECCTRRTASPSGSPVRSRSPAGSAPAPRRSSPGSPPPTTSSSSRSRREEMLARAAEIEGHPDNVAAAIYGGFVDLRRARRRAGGGALRPSRGARGDRGDPRRGGLDRGGARGDARAGAARRRGRQRRRRRAAGARPAARRTSTWSARGPAATGCTSPTGASSTRARWSCVEGARELGRDRRHDLRRRAHRAGLDRAGRTTGKVAAELRASGRRAGPRSGGCRSRRTGWTCQSSDGLGGPDRPDRAGDRRPARLGDGGAPGAARVDQPDRHRRARGASSRSTSTT